MHKRLLPKEFKVILSRIFDNGIKIGPTPLWNDDYGKWTVEITMNGKTFTDPKKYIKDIIMQKVYEYCDYYYNKYG